MYHKVDNFPVYAAGANGVKKELKNLPQVHELRAGIVRFNLGIKNVAAATFLAKAKPNDGTAPGGTNDAQKILGRVIKRAYLKRDGVEKAYNAAPEELTIAYGGQHRRCMVNSDLIDGDVIPATAGPELLFSIDVIFDFTHSGFGDTPNKYTGGTEQALVGGGWEFSYDTDGSALLAIVLANATADVTVKSVELGVDIEPCDFPIVSPVWLFDDDRAPDLNHEKIGARIELLVYDKQLPSALQALLTTINVKNEGAIDEVKDATPNALAAAYRRSQKGLDGLNPFAVERSCTPLRFVTSLVHPEEREVRVTFTKRNINFQGSGTTRQMMNHRILPFKEKAAEICEAVLAQYPKVKATRRSWDQLPVRFPSRDPLIDAVFGTRILVP